jgi:hypothetical protein
MADLITIKAGSRVRIEGQSYEVAENTDTRADLVEVQQQKNRHFAVVCTNPACIEARAAKGRKPIVYRASRETWAEGLPPCGSCNGHLSDGSKVTMQPRGWSLEDSAEGDDE